MSVHAIEPRPVDLGEILSGHRRVVTDRSSGIRIGHVVTAATAPVLGEVRMTHVDRSSDGLVYGGTLQAHGVLLGMQGTWGLVDLARQVILDPEPEVDIS